eukprot:GHVN01064890.1.p1 GENE.GHVN01064890.1~~GHVN01064890.1.p1  ORF type:complete len:421 (+),score=45.24 GHVN01064890.1:1852-3114(+)
MTDGSFYRLKRKCFGGEGAKVWADPDDETVMREVFSSSSDNGTKSLNDVSWVDKARVKQRKAHKRETASPLGDVESLLASSEVGLSDNRGCSKVSKSIQLSRAGQVKEQEQCRCSVRALEFHPKSSIFMAGGFDKTLRLFQVTEDDVTKVAAVHFDHFPIQSAKFVDDGQSALLVPECGKKIVEYDLSSGGVSVVPGIFGRDDKRYRSLAVSPAAVLRSTFSVCTEGGYCLVCDVRSKRMIRAIKTNNPIVGQAYHPELSVLYTVDTFGEIYSWDLGSGSCINHFLDQGSHRATFIAASRSQEGKPRLLCGSRSGYVNLFDVSSQSGRVLQESERCFDSLTTATGFISFHKSNKIAAISSPFKAQAVRLLDLERNTTLSGWPGKTPVKNVSSTAFSDVGGYFAVGEEDGRIQVFQTNILA